MKRVVISVKSTQRDKLGHDEVVELVSMGRYYERRGIQYIIYEETEVTGLEGVRTTIKVSPKSVILIRHGKVNMKHVYEMDKIHESLYRTSFGDLDMLVKTHELSSNIVDGVGHVHLGYDISIAGDWTYYNQLDITLKEDTTHGN